MLHNNMNISRLIVHAQQVEETRLRRMNREAKKAKAYECCLIKCRLDIQDNPRFMKRFSKQIPSKFPEACDDRVSYPKSQKGRGSTSPKKKQTCGKCGKKHYGDCLVRTDNFFRCGKSGHKVMFFPNVKGQDKDRGQSQASNSTVDTPKKNHFYALRSRGEQGCLPMW